MDDALYCSKACWQRSDRLAKQEPIEIRVPDSHELAWAAGFFDGEGSFSVTSGAKYAARNGKPAVRLYLRLSVTQKYVPLLERLRGNFGVGAICRQNESESHPFCHSWQCNGRVAFYIASLLWPWLGEQKKSDFKRALKRSLDSRGDMGRTYKGRPVIYMNGGQ